MIVLVTAVQCYEDAGRPIILGIMNWARIQKFCFFLTVCEEWEDPEDISTCSKDVPIMQLLELIKDHLHNRLGVRKTPLPYVIRDSLAAPAINKINVDAPYSEDIDSFHKELIERVSHNHLHYAHDNATILDILVECLKSTRHFSDLKTFQRRRYRKRSLEALVLHNRGNSK